MANKSVKKWKRWALMNRPKVKRPKTFKTEESAKIYAEKHKIKDYTLVNLKNPDHKNKKFRIVI